MDQRAQAFKEAREALKLMPKGWKVRVWDNCGWNWALVGIGGHINIYATDYLPVRYHALADITYPCSGDMEWGTSGNYKHPLDAAKKIESNLHRHLRKLGTFHDELKKLTRGNK